MEPAITANTILVILVRSNQVVWVSFFGIGPIKDHSLAILSEDQEDVKAEC